MVPSKGREAGPGLPDQASAHETVERILSSGSTKRSADATTLSQLAAAQTRAVTEAQVRSRLIANLTPLLDTAGQEGEVDAQDRLLLVDEELQNGIGPVRSRRLV